MSRRLANKRLWLAIMVVIVAMAWLVMAEGIATAEDEGEDEDKKADDLPKDALRKALGYDPSQITEPTPQVEPVSVPELEVKASPEEERASYLQAQLEHIQAEQKKLEALKADIQSDLKSLEKVRAEIERRLTGEDKKTAEKIAKLIKIYAKMPIEKLTKVLNEQPEGLRIKLLFHMKEKRVSEILANMDPQEAAMTSRLLLNKKTK